MAEHQGRGVALVTGASAGIGAVYADRLAARGYDLLLVARDEARLKALAADIGARTGRAVEVLRSDLTDKADLAAVEARLRADPAITLLVNNAGVAGGGLLETADADQMEAMIDLNVVALTRLSLAALPGFVARSSGTIINVGSVVAFVPDVYPGIYGSTKAYVLYFTQSLHTEVSAKGVRVQAVLPGATATEIWRTSGLSLDALPPEMVMTTENLVDAALAGLDQGELVTIPPLPDGADWEAFEAARLVLAPNLSRREPAARYQAAARAAA